MKRKVSGYLLLCLIAVVLSGCTDAGVVGQKGIERILALKDDFLAKWEDFMEEDTESKDQTELTKAEEQVTELEESNPQEFSDGVGAPESEAAGTEAKTGETGAEPDSLEADAGRYAYKTLSESEQQVYEMLSEAIETLEIVTLDQEMESGVVKKVFYALLADRPDIFWVDGYRFKQYTKGEEFVKEEIIPNYIMSEAEIKERQTGIQEFAAACLSGISDTASDYEKVKYVYDYILEHTDYVTGSKENQAITSVFLYGESVCSGYSKAAQYLLNELGITCTLVTGSAKGQDHAWNLLAADGEWYYMDVTWGEANYSNLLVEGSEYEQENRYAYFCVTTEELLKTHTPEMLWELPVSTATACSYYRQEGFFVETEDSAVLDAYVDRAKAEGKKGFSLKFKNEALYEEAIRYYITNGNIFQNFDTQINASYSESKEELILTIFWHE